MRVCENRSLQCMSDNALENCFCLIFLLSLIIYTKLGVFFTNSEAHLQLSGIINLTPSKSAPYQRNLSHLNRRNDADQAVLLTPCITRQEKIITVICEIRD